VTGRVFDSSNGWLLLGVEVRVEGTNSAATTDLYGSYLIEGIAPGKVMLIFSKEGYRTVSVSDVSIAEEAPARIDVTLESESSDVVRLETFTVTAEEVENSPTRQIMARKAAVVPIERFDSTDFAKFPAADAADLLRLMPGINIASGPSGRFAVVRGLSERYNPVLLDGVVLPSPDPERQTPHLDLFPSKLMDALVVFKAASPDLPSFASGGAIDIRTRPFPDERNGQIQIGFRADEGVFHGEEFHTYRTDGWLDHLAYGNNDRAKGLPNVRLDSGSLFHFQDAETTFGYRAKSLPIGLRLAGNFEDRKILGESERELGYSFHLTYDSGYSTRSRFDVERSSGAFLPGQPPPPLSDPESYDANESHESLQEISVGLIGVAGLRLGDGNSVTLSTFIAQNGEDVVTVGVGRGQSGTYPYHSLHYKQRNLTSLRLGGEHSLGQSIDGKLRWRISRLGTSQEEPDYRFVPYELNSGAGGAFGMIAGGPERRVTRYWREVQEDTWSASFDYGARWFQGLLPEISFRVGLMLETTDRGFDETGFYWNGSSFTFDDFDLELAYEMNRRAFGPGNVPSAGMNDFSTDVSAERSVAAPFASASFRLWEGADPRHHLTLNCGAQLENYRMDASGLNLWGNYSVGAFYQQNPWLVSDARYEPDGPFDFFRRYFVSQRENSLHPSAGLVFAPEENFYLRLNVSQTTARPSFREAGPYYTVDQITLANVAGNIALRQSAVSNYDLRAEYFFNKSLDLVAFSVFAKDIEDPIERIGLEGEFNPKLTDTWVNNPATAHVRGLETEFRKSLGFIHDNLSGVTLGGNATWIDAEVGRIEREQKNPALFRSKRRLFDQPEWILNGHVTVSSERFGFSTTFSASVLSDTLRVANQVQVDEFAEGYTRLDLTVSQRIGKRWTLRCSASNLGNPERRIILDPDYVDAATAGGFAFSRWREGRSFSLSLQRQF